jgi:hypothetical protein
MVIVAIVVLPLVIFGEVCSLFEKALPKFGNYKYPDDKY